MNNISQTTFSNVFSSMKMFEFRLKFHWSLFPRVQLTIFHHWFRKWLGAVQATSHYLNQWWLVYRRIYASRGFNELSAHYNCFMHITTPPLWWHVHNFEAILSALLNLNLEWNSVTHYTDVIMAAIASQITSLTIVYSTVYSDADQRKHQSSASLAFVRGIHRPRTNGQ